MHQQSNCMNRTGSKPIRLLRDLQGEYQGPSRGRKLRISISNFYPPCARHYVQTKLRNILRCVALIRADNLSIHELGIAICRVDDQLPVRNRKGLEAISRSELIAPGTTDGVDTASDVAITGLRSWTTGCGVRARNCCCQMCVDGVRVST